jgi:hypothetical protein
MFSPRRDLYRSDRENKIRRNKPSESKRNQRNTNVSPIIRTHNILTSHNWTHNNPLKPIKTKLYYYGFVSQQETSEKLLWELCWMIFLRVMP